MLGRRSAASNEEKRTQTEVKHTTLQIRNGYRMTRSLNILLLAVTLFAMSPGEAVIASPAIGDRAEIGSYAHLTFSEILSDGEAICASAPGLLYCRVVIEQERSRKEALVQVERASRHEKLLDDVFARNGCGHSSKSCNAEALDVDLEIAVSEELEAEREEAEQSVDVRSTEEITGSLPVLPAGILLRGGVASGPSGIGEGPVRGSGDPQSDWLFSTTTNSYITRSVYTAGVGESILARLYHSIKNGYAHGDAENLYQHHSNRPIPVPLALFTTAASAFLQVQAEIPYNCRTSHNRAPSTLRSSSTSLLNCGCEQNRPTPALSSHHPRSLQSLSMPSSLSLLLSFATLSLNYNTQEKAI
jgi:hypothetical protein